MLTVAKLESHLEDKKIHILKHQLSILSMSSGSSPRSRTDSRGQNVPMKYVVVTVRSDFQYSALFFCSHQTFYFNLNSFKHFFFFYREE